MAHSSTHGPIEDDDDDWPHDITMTGNVLRQYGDDVSYEIINVLP